MKNITFPILSACLISFGAILAVWGVLLDSPRDYINASYIGSDRPGMIVALSDPSVINNYMRYRNKAVLSLVLIVLGFFLGLPIFGNFTISSWQLGLLILVLFLFSLVVAGRTRKNVIEKWHQSECKISWFMELLDEPYYLRQYDKWKQTNQGNEFLENTMSDFKHISVALDIDTRKYTSVSSEHVDRIRQDIKNEVKNRSLFYYLFKPKKLLNAYK
jgi:hypothetical protein